MTSAENGMRLCPTRVDKEQALFAHSITRSMCQKRQREHYHKCPGCEHYNARLHAPEAAKPQSAAKREPLRNRMPVS